MEKKSRKTSQGFKMENLNLRLIIFFKIKGEILIPAVINSGHFDIVEDICWEPGQNYFLTVSKDQTTRFHGCWHHNGIDTWHEIGRPQIHGYDLHCVAFIDRSKFVSGADEKVLRIFVSPKNFFKNYCTLSQDQSVNEFLKVILKNNVK